jgi:hypothetical protein
MSEEWIRWIPISGLAPKYSIESVSDSFDGFKVVLFEEFDKKERVIIKFEETVSAYRSTDESYRSKLIVDLDKKYGRDFYGDWTFFKVNNSLYLQWLSEQSCTISDHINLLHYVILGGDFVVDFISGLEPNVEIIKLP